MVLGKYGYVYPGKGRPIVRSDENRREEITDSAIGLYAEKGCSSVTFKDIAKACHLNPATIYYYFAGKDKLLDEIVRDRVAPAFAYIWEEENNDSPEGILTRMVERIFESCQKMPALPALWVQDILPTCGELRAYMLKYAPTEAMAKFHGALREFQQKGKLDSNMIPEYLPFTIFSLTLFPLASRKPSGTLAALPTLSWEDISANALNLILKAVIK